MWKAVFVLLCSNVFMTFAWYAHLRNLHDKAWYTVALASWGFALFEYLYRCRSIVWATECSIWRN